MKFPEPVHERNHSGYHVTSTSRALNHINLNLQFNVQNMHAS